MHKRSRKTRVSSPLAALLAGCGIAGAVFVLISLFFSFVTILLSDPTAVIPWLTLPSFMISGCIDAWIIYSPAKRNLRSAFLSVLLFLLLLLLAGVILCHGAVSARIFLFDIGYIAAFFIGCALRTVGKKRRVRF